MIYHPNTLSEAVMLRKEHADTTAYLAGGTEVLRLHSPAEGKDLIDLTHFDLRSVEVKGDRLYIGALCTLQQIIECALVPDFIREAAAFCASFARRNSATVGGNIGARRQDSYLAAALTAAEATVYAVTPHGEEEKLLGDYFNTSCKRLITHIILPKDCTGWVKRFGRTSGAHAAVIAAQSGEMYALSVSGSPLTFGKTPELYRDMTFTDDLTGSADYKRYLASTVFSMRG